MKNNPLDFQKASARHVLDAFKRGQKRVLIADEPGLGKTTVAADVVGRVKKELANEVLEDDGLYCVVYVCCNLQIAQQNINSLSEDGEKVDLTQSRLSMQHFVYYRKKVDLKAKGKDTLILSLTPATSFQMSWGTGSAAERALMYSCLTLLRPFSAPEYAKILSGILVCGALKSWGGLSAFYHDEVRRPDMEDYRRAITEALSTKLALSYSDKESYLQCLTRLCDSRPDEKDSQQTKEWETDCYNIITKLRKIFAQISLEILKPDLVIMDEFQKFSSLIDNENSNGSEENMIARKFFANKNTFILLLSATPYKPYTTLEELNESKNDEQYKDFHRLMDFLNVKHSDNYYFKRIWRNYSTALKHLDSEDAASVALKHKEAEEMLYRVMGRTERTNEGIFEEIIPDLVQHLSPGDIRSFCQIQQLMDNCRKFGKRMYSAPVDYTKSTAFQLSFMDNYILKESIVEAWKEGAGHGAETDCLLLDRNEVENYSLSDYKNAKLSYLIDNIFGHARKSTGAESLLWIPTSHPYYTQSPNVFTKNRTFSKYLIFSSWGMVPKMLACLISYEVERRLLSRTKEGYQKKEPQLLRDNSKTKALALMQTVSTYLAELYDPEEHFGRPLSEIKHHLKTKIKERLSEFDGKIVSRVSSLDVLSFLGALDNEECEIRNIPAGAETILADMAIGAPAMCLFRIFKRLGDEQAKLHAEEVAKELISIFNTRQGIGAVRSVIKSHGNYFQNVIEYCVMGDLQAVMDEFVHMIGENKSPESIALRLKESFAPTYPQAVNTLQTFGSDERFSMRKHFAVDFGSKRLTEEKINRSINIRSAFNSPFRPFVLASTSVGQEGLDFHWYCRKIVHWNLPSNPQNLEQRERRINRYKCLSVRRNVSKLYSDVFSWKDMFSRAFSELRGENSEMVPFWFLPLKDERFKGIIPEKIERIVPMFPLSEDQSRYSRLIKILSLYRLTMGQPRQEELLQMLAGKITPEQISDLLFDLCPFNRNRKKPT